MLPLEYPSTLKTVEHFTYSLELRAKNKDERLLQGRGALARDAGTGPGQGCGGVGVMMCPWKTFSETFPVVV